MDGFFSGCGPWFAAITVVAAFGAFASPIAASQWFSRIGAAAFLVAIVLSLWLDFAYFRDGLGRTRQRAAVDVVVQRAIAWSITVAYFIATSSPKISFDASKRGSESLRSATMTRWWIPAALVIALIAGTLADRPRDREPMTAGDYVVLSGDFHLHSGLTSGGTMTPWGLVGEAMRQDLDVVAITGHNEAWGGRTARTFSHFVAGPIVLAGEEVTSATQDLIAVGIESTVSPSLPLVDQIAEIHRQGGVAIAAHPIARFHAPYIDTGAISALDGTEVCHPVIYERQGSADELMAFAARYERDADRLVRLSCERSRRHVPDLSVRQ